jgi:uncharacterized protein (DUF488 family)
MARATPPAKKVLFTAGLGAREMPALLELLQRAKVTTVVDIRRYGTSAHHENHVTAVLHPALTNAGLHVLDLGRLLGGDRRGGYPRYMETAAFRKGIERLEAAAGGGPTVLLCAEREPDRCHRRFLAETLEARGWIVNHLLDTPRERAARGEFRLVDVET